ncbi:MAG: TIR domain-containing protein [Vicinamibacterales bacterium]
MRLIDQFHVDRRRGSAVPAAIELLQGDLSVIPAEHAVDALVVSAYPDSYTPNPGTLFEDLLARGLDMQDVARAKDEDQRSRLGCWISAPLPPVMAERFNFRRILCFEPRYPAFVAGTGFDGDSIPKAAGFVFRALNNFVIPDSTDVEGERPVERRHFDIARVAMPLLATGNQRVPIDAMLPSLLEAAVAWLEEGLPIDRLKIVAFSDAEAEIAARVFGAVASARRAAVTAGPHPGPALAPGHGGPDPDALARDLVDACRHHLRADLLAVAVDQERQTLEALFERLDQRDAAHRPEPTADPCAATAPAPAQPYDVFVSYAHKQDDQVRAFVAALRRHHPELRVFYDRDAIPEGGRWIRLISDAVHRARVFLAVLSPDYSASGVCWDEFECAKLVEYNTRRSIIRTVRFMKEPSPPPIMGIHSYVDCTEGDLVKLLAYAATDFC